MLLDDVPSGTSFSCFVQAAGMDEVVFLPRTSMANACQSVLSLYDLLEPILRCLDAKELLRAKRVCRQWRDTVDQTPALRQALFLEPRANAISSKQAAHIASREELAPVTNPWLQESTILADPTRIINIGLSCLPASFQDSEASWRRMLVTQPPVTNIVLDLNYKHVFQCFAYEHEITNPAGVTVGNFVDALLRLSQSSGKPRWVQIRKPLSMVEIPCGQSQCCICLLYTSPSPRDGLLSRMPSSA